MTSSAHRRLRRAVRDGMLERKAAPVAGDRAWKRISSDHVELKADGEEEGHIVALVYDCTGTPDEDGDLIAPSAFHAGDVAVMSQWGHSSFGSELPAGVGAIRVDGTKILFVGRLFIETDHGLATFRSIKGLGARAEFSIGYLVRKWRAPTPEEEARGVVRVILDLEIFEVSPVVRGAAGEGRSGTVSIKTGLTDADREAMLVIRAKIMKTPAQEWAELKELALRTEIKRYSVPVKIRQAAERGAKIAATVLLYDTNAAAPTVRWLSDECAKQGRMLGCVFGGGSREVWVKASLDERWAFDTSGHEVHHVLRPHADESDTLRFGRLLEAIHDSGKSVILGRRDQHVFYEDLASSVLIEPDLTAFEFTGWIGGDRQWDELGILA